LGYDDPYNDCDHCVNGMENLLDPILKLRNFGAQMATLNGTLSQYLADQQPEIDRLVGLQGDITNNIYDWNINDLDGGWSSSDTDYIDGYIERELETFKNRYKKDYPYIEGMMDNWIRELESLKDLMAECDALQERANDLIGRINNNEFGDLDDLNYDCCPQEPPYSEEDQLSGIDDLLAEMDELFEDYLDYRSSMVDMAAHFTELLKNMLLIRAVEEGTMEERKDQYSEGLFSFLIGEIVDGMKTALSQAVQQEGVKLTSAQQNALNAFAEAAGPKIKALISGGATGVTSAMVNDIIALAGADMSENDLAALQTIGGEIFGSIAGAVVEKQQRNY